MPDSKYKPPYEFSTHIGAACNQQSRTFADLAEKLKMDVTHLMKHTVQDLGQGVGEGAGDQRVVPGEARG
jgi:hypothetical protein